MGSDQSKFSDDEWVYVPICGLQGAMDLRPVSLPSSVPSQIKEKYPNFR